MIKTCILVSFVLLASCAVLDYKPQIVVAGDPSPDRIEQDLSDCKQLAKTSTVNSTEATMNQLPATVRFKEAYDNCLIGRGHKVMR